MAISCAACGAENDDDAAVCFGCRTLLGALTRGTVVGGRYELVAVLGRGGMGTVYRATDRVLGEQVALKVLRSEVAGTPEMARRFQDEIRLALDMLRFNSAKVRGTVLTGVDAERPA